MPVGAAAIAKALQSNQCAIENLQLFNNSGIDDGACVLLANALIHNSSIEYLDLSRCNIGNKGAVAVAEALQCTHCAIVELDLSLNSGIGNEGYIAVADSLACNDSIKILKISDCNVGGDGMKAIANILQSNQAPFLEDLTLSWDSELVNEGFDAFARALLRNCTLKKLDLNRCILSTQECVTIMNVLSKNSSLHFLGLRLCTINDANAKAVGNFLRCDTGSLETLEIRSTKRCDGSYIAIANALPFNSHLIKLDISTDELTKEEWGAFDVALCQNYFLEELLDYHKNETYEPIERHRKPVLESLSLNKELGPVKAEIFKTGSIPQWLLQSLDEDSMSAPCFVEVISILLTFKDLDVIFELVQERPSLFDFDHVFLTRPAKRARTQ